MRRLIAAGVLLLFVAVCCVAGQIIVTHYGDDMTDSLNSAREAALQEDFEQAAHSVKRAEDEYAKKEWVLSCFIDHNLVEELGEQLAELPSLAAEGSKEEFLSHLDAAKIKILHIIRDNRFSARNIF